jgi:hypothetical protein
MQAPPTRINGPEATSDMKSTAAAEFSAPAVVGMTYSRSFPPKTRTSQQLESNKAKSHPVYERVSLVVALSIPGACAALRTGKGVLVS